MPRLVVVRLLDKVLVADLTRNLISVGIDDEDALESSYSSGIYSTRNHHIKTFQMYPMTHEEYHTNQIRAQMLTDQWKQCGLPGSPRKSDLLFHPSLGHQHHKRMYPYPEDNNLDHIQRVSDILMGIDHTLTAIEVAYRSQILGEDLTPEYLDVCEGLIDAFWLQDLPLETLILESQEISSRYIRYKFPMGKCRYLLNQLGNKD